MSGNITFTMIKPNRVKDNDVGAIMKMINDDGFTIRAMKMKWLNRTEAERFYAVHKGKPFYERLVEFMSSAPVVAMVLEKEDAIAAYRKLIGATNPQEAEEGTIRHIFGENVTYNAVHGADSDENAKIEAGFFFSACEQYFEY